MKIIMYKLKQMVVFVFLFSWVCLLILVCYALVSDNQNSDSLIKVLSKTASLWEAVFGLL